MDAVRWVRHPVALDDVEVAVDEEDIGGGAFIEAEPELLRAWSLTARRDLTVETRVVPGVEQDPTRECQLLSSRPVATSSERIRPIMSTDSGHRDHHHRRDIIG